MKKFDVKIESYWSNEFGCIAFLYQKKDIKFLLSLLNYPFAINGLESIFDIDLSDLDTDDAVKFLESNFECEVKILPDYSLGYSSKGKLKNFYVYSKIDGKSVDLLECGLLKDFVDLDPEGWGAEDIETVYINLDSIPNAESPIYLQNADKNCNLEVQKETYYWDLESLID